MMKTTCIGILGGGQLGRMLAQAALPLGIKCVFLEDAPNCPAKSMGQVFTTNQLAEFTASADMFTLEFENTPVTTVEALTEKGIAPNARVLAVAQDRLLEKQTFESLNISTVPFEAVNSQTDLTTAANKLGLPLVLKTTRGGYDGKGQFVINTMDDIAAAWQALGKASPLIAEGFIDFEREVSIIAVRSKTGEIKTYPLVENHHHQGILSHSIAPAPNTMAIDAKAKEAITTLLNHFDYVGVLTLELFVTTNGLLANEIAPRVHNSGHWSIEGAVCSQFENHMRAVAGLPLGSTEIIKPSVMVNIIGQYPKTQEVLAITDAHLHLYHKEERTDRKIGHITLVPNTDAQHQGEPQIKATLNNALTNIAKVLPNKMGLAN